jgi:uncharacterized protein (DUF3820 family)
MSRSDLTQAKLVVMPFGKHRGKTLGDILDQDAAYLDWLYDKCDNLQLQAAVATINLQCQDRIQQALAQPRRYGGPQPRRDYLKGGRLR